MKKIVLGYIYNSSRSSVEEKKFFKIAKKKNIELVPFNIAEDLDENEIEEKAKRCNLIFNDDAENIAIELVKTLEALGKRVIDASSVTYYIEDKWIFFVKCKKYKIPIPETILLSTDLNSAKKELINFNRWPVILKRIYGSRGEFVGRSKNINGAIKLIKNFWEKGNERLPIIAQEFIDSDSYRVTLIGDKIVQTAIKKRHGWKATGCNDVRFNRFKVDKDLRNLIKKIVVISGIKICGIDFAKKDGKWMVIEVNAEPSLKLFTCEHDKLIEDTLDFLKKLI